MQQALERGESAGRKGFVDTGCKRALELRNRYFSSFGKEDVKVQKESLFDNLLVEIGTLAASNLSRTEILSAVALLLKEKVSYYDW